MSTSLRRLGAALVVLVLSLAAPASPAGAADTYTWKLLAKAAPDECFNGIGNPYPEGPPCAEGQEKVTQAYVWGLTRVGSDVWFGTGADVNCLVSGATLDVVNPVVNSDYVCEYGESQIVQNNPDWPVELGDQRSPEVWLYNSRTGTKVNKSAEIDARSADDAYRRSTTIGLRAAGNLNNVVLLGGPALNDSLNLFAFDARSKAFLGSVNLPQYGNIRTFLVAEGAMYLGVGIGANGSSGGGVLRWTGTASDPFQFDVVASLPVQAADLTYYDGRIATTSWPAAQPTSTSQLAGLWISPKLAEGSPGLTADDAAGWTQVWNARQYETDRIIGVTYGGGGIAAFGDYVYWGTMHVPLKATKVYQNKYPQDTDEKKQEQAAATQRAISIWRGKNLGTADQQIELLYGSTQLPAYTAETNTWSQVSTGWTPLYGKAGFDNQFNNYTWRMLVLDGKLYVGTMDWSYIVQDLTSSGTRTDALTREALGVTAIDPSVYGGDLWMFPSTEEKAVPISTQGLGNYLNYGIRNMIPAGDGSLFVGMANPMNLRTDTTDDVPEGGWELIKLTPPCP